MQPLPFGCGRKPLFYKFYVSRLHSTAMVMDTCTVRLGAPCRYLCKPRKYLVGRIPADTLLPPPPPPHVFTGYLDTTSYKGN